MTTWLIPPDVPADDLRLKKRVFTPRVPGSQRLDQSGPTVSQTVSRMEYARDVDVWPVTSHLELTDKGRAWPFPVMSKHRLAERLLVDVIGLPWEEVHAELALEHVMSETRDVGLCKCSTIRPPHRSANPIPGSWTGVGEGSAPRMPIWLRLRELPDGSPSPSRGESAHPNKCRAYRPDHRLKGAGVSPTPELPSRQPAGGGRS